jgi:lipopolysaccharide export system permease protein
MLKILDRYIIKKFLTTFFFMILVVMTISIIFDLSDRLSDYIEKKAPIKAIFLDYYFNFFLYFANMFSSLILFISVIWFTSKLAQNSEIIPMLNSGKPRRRLLRPYMISTTIIVAISLIMNHFILPDANKKRLDFEEEFYRIRMLVSNYYADISQQETIFFKSYNSDVGFLEFFGMTHRDSTASIDIFLSADKAHYEGENIWRLENYMIRYVGEQNDSLIHGPSLDTIFAFEIQDLAHRDNIVETMGYQRINDFIDYERAKGSSEVAEYELKMYQRTSIPFAAFILTLIGFSVASQRKRGGLGINLAIGLFFVFIYIFSMQITSVAAINLGLPTLLASWMPNILFGVIAVLVYRWSRT